MNMAIAMRPARREDADFLAWAMLRASRGHRNRGVWDLIIGTDEAGCLEYLRRLAAAEPPSLCHYESFWVAEEDGRPGAALSTFNMRTGGWAVVAQAMACVQRDLGWTRADVSASYQRAAPAWGCFLPEIGADWGIENIATRPECARRGLARALLGHALRQGRERGCTLAQIISLIGNLAAQSAYQKCGFRIAEEKRCEEMESVLGAPGFARFLCNL